MITTSDKFKRAIIYEQDADIEKKPLAVDIPCIDCNTLIQYRLSIKEAQRETFDRPCPVCGLINIHHVPRVLQQVASDADKCERKREAERNRIREKRKTDPAYGQLRRIDGYIYGGTNRIPAEFNIRLKADGSWEGWASIDPGEFNSWEARWIKASDMLEIGQDGNLKRSYIKVREHILDEVPRPRINFEGMYQLTLD